MASEPISYPHPHPHYQGLHLPENAFWTALASSDAATAKTAAAMRNARLKACLNAAAAADENWTDKGDSAVGQAQLSVTAAAAAAAASSVEDDYAVGQVQLSVSAAVVATAAAGHNAAAAGADTGSPMAPYSDPGNWIVAAGILTESCPLSQQSSARCQHQSDQMQSGLPCGLPDDADATLFAVAGMHACLVAALGILDLASCWLHSWLMTDHAHLYGQKEI